MTNTERFEDGMGAKLVGTKLQWNHEDAWIEAEDLPTTLINEMKQQPYYAACMICEMYLDGEEFYLPLEDNDKS
ncbi:MAG: hypothetical protein B7Y23_02805 [Sulfurovum sp. 16-42-52]|nr:MAG: hypothetical protein B7Y23_02805 [Sulfurovum sp. 16-42-52]OZA46174.1 MAG: hypothetical protein B7X80_03235 [Sulfurovum sp. 17-42-90]